MILFLIGMMGAGKTTIGKLLANKLNYNFTDTDNEIALFLQRNINEVISNEGISYFRDVENKVIKNLTLEKNSIVSCGGGVILNDENILFMKQKGSIIFLNVSPTELINRLKKTNITNRPLLKNNLIESINNIYNERIAIYQSVCDYEIYCDNLNEMEIIETIISLLKIKNASQK